MILGAVLAGGASSRFGSDKALAELEGRSLLAMSVDALAGLCDHVIVAGRPEAPAPTVPDWPRAGMGPLGGLAAALRLAQDDDYEAVLSCGVDVAILPDDLLDSLSPGPAYLSAQPVIGLWPTSVMPVLEELLHSDDRHSMFRFGELIAARRVESSHVVPNVNTRADLAALAGKR